MLQTKVIKKKAYNLVKARLYDLQLELSYKENFPEYSEESKEKIKTIVESEIERVIKLIDKTDLHPKTK